MLPVTSDNIIMIDLDKAPLYLCETRYLSLLKEQIYWLNRHRKQLERRSQMLYKKYNEGSLEKNIADRCCNFKLLEKKCFEYQKKLKNNA